MIPEPSFDQTITNFMAANSDIKKNNKWYNRAVLEVSPKGNITTRILGPLELLIYKITGYINESSRFSSAAKVLRDNSSNLIPNQNHLEFVRVINAKITTHNNKKNAEQIEKITFFTKANAQPLKGAQQVPAQPNVPQSQEQSILQEFYSHGLYKPQSQQAQKPAVPNAILPQPAAAKPPVVHQPAPPPPQVDDCGNCCEVPALGLHNFGRPKLNNICWMNSACQIVFRSPGLLKRVLEFSQIADPSTVNPKEKLIILLSKLAQAMRDGADINAIRDIQEEMIDAYCLINKGFKVGTQHDPTDFIVAILETLKIDCMVATTDTKGVLSKSTNAAHLTVGYHHGLSFEESMKKANTWATITVDDPAKPGTKKDVHLHKYMTKVPKLVMVKIQNHAKAPKSFDAFSNSIDFSPLFSDEIRAQNKNLRYKLSAATKHSDPMRGVSGHYTAQENKARRHFNDEIVKILPVKDAQTVLGFGSHQIWELEDPTSASS